MGETKNGSKGIKLMYIAELGTIICIVLALIPLINLIAAIGALVFSVLSIVGVYQAGKEIEDCKKAFILTIVSLVVSLLGFIFKSGVLSTIINIAIYVLGFLVVYLVCSSVGQIMTQLSAPEIAKDGDTAVKINLVCYAAMVIVSILGLIPFMSGFAIILNIIASIVGIIGSVFYMLFLKKSYEKMA
ncbi:MAG: hypothetical protein ACI4R6_02235 [Lachnospiraceae bacterium]